MSGLTTASHRRCQRGAATLALTLLLLFAMTLLLGFTNRSLLFESRASANQYRATQAFEAAEAGLEWAHALLNSTRRVAADCKPSDDEADTTFRERYLARATLGAPFTPRTRMAGSTEVALRAACVLGDDGWACSCPTDGEPLLTAPAGSGTHPAFLLSFATGSHAGIVRVVATGCASLGDPCSAGAGKADARATVQQSLALVPALANPPAAPLTVRSGVHVGAASPGFYNTQSTGSGVTVHAGGPIEAPHARLHVPPGSPAAASRVAQDASLAAMSQAQLFNTLFRMDMPRWKTQPGVLALTCPVPCNDALAAALADAGATPQLLWVSGDLVLEDGMAIGSAERPVVLVVDGDARWRGAITLHGLLHAANIRWDDTPAVGARLRGAAVASGGYRGNGSPDLVYDRALLERLGRLTGTLVRVPGSWRDF